MQVNSITKVNQANNADTTSTKKITSGNSFKSYLGESKSLDEIFQKAADKYGVDVNLLKAMGKVESNFNTNAVSKAGAQGIMQLMPKTAKGLGVTNSFDAEQNINGAAKLMASHLEKYNGDVKLSLAAYNAGGGNVKKYGGIPPFKETQNYVNKIMKLYNGDTKIDTSKVSTASGSSSEKVVEYYPGNTVDLDSVGKSLAESREELKNMSASQISSGFSYDSYLKFLETYLQNSQEQQTDGQTAYNNLSQSAYTNAIKSLLNQG